MPKKKSNRKIIIAIACAVLVIAAAYGVYALADQDALRDWLSGFLEQARGTPFALPFICLVYLVSGAVLFPVMVLNLAVAMTFGALWGTIYSLTGALLSAVVYFALGRLARKRGLEKILHNPRIKKIDDALRNSGVIGIALLRLMPIAPYSVFNFAAGISSVRFADYIAGTFLALLPGSIARGIVGESLTDIILDPSRENLIWLGGGLLLWVGIMAGSHLLIKKYQPCQNAT